MSFIQWVPFAAFLVALVFIPATSGIPTVFAQEAAGRPLETALEEGSALLLEGSYDQAVDAFKRANRLAKNSSPEAYWGLARAYFLLGKYEESVENCKKAAALSHDRRFEAEVRNLAGMALKAWADTAEALPLSFIVGSLVNQRRAETEFRKAIQLDPQLAAAHFNLGFELWTEWPGREAFEELQKYLALEPQGAESDRARQIVSSAPVRISLRELESKLISRVEPEYPPIARAARIKGTVKLVVIVDRNGAIRRQHVISGHPLLVQAAIKAVSQWRYEPALAGGNGLEVISEVHVDFR